MKHRVQRRLDELLDHGLRNPIRHSRDAQFSRASLCLRNLDLLHRRREIRTRRHPVPQLVEILRQVLLEHRDCFVVDAGSTAVGLYLLICLPHCAFRNYIRFRRSPIAHPRLRVGNLVRPDNAAPSLPSHYKSFFATMGNSAPRSGIGILPHGVCHLSFPFSSRTKFSRSAPKPALRSCRLNTDCHRASKQASSRLILELLGGSSFRQCLKFLTMRHRTVRFRSSSQRSPDVLSGRLFLGRSPPRLLGAAAPGGLKPAPESRLREASSHLQYSSPSSYLHS